METVVEPRDWYNLRKALTLMERDIKALAETGTHTLDQNVLKRTRQYDRTAALEERIRELEDVVSSSFQSFRGALQQISSHVGLQDVTGTLVGFTARSAEDQAIHPDIQAESTPEVFEPQYERKDLIDKGVLTLEDCRMLFDLHNTSKTYFVSESDRYTRLGSHLTSMPYRRNVDYRIRAYLEIYGILNQAKKDVIISDNIQQQPITSDVCRQLQLYDKQLQGWFRRNDEEMDPIYQTFSKPQDRNRMAIPYNFARMHLNGLVLHGLKPDSASNDPLRVQFIRAAVDAGKALLKCALRSIDYQANLNYSIDYSGSALGLAINFLSRATCVAYDCIDLEGVMRILAQARDMFEGAKLAGKADEVSHILDQVAEIKRTMTATKPRNDTTEADINDNVDDGSDFFLNAVSSTTCGC
ncbi:hypothetical protein APSETT445_000073 [Aspergillus pseudonomiae]